MIEKRNLIVVCVGVTPLFALRSKTPTHTPKSDTPIPSLPPHRFSLLRPRLRFRLRNKKPCSGRSILRLPNMISPHRHKGGEAVIYSTFLRVPPYPSLAPLARILSGILPEGNPYESYAPVGWAFGHCLRVAFKGLTFGQPFRQPFRSPHTPPSLHSTVKNILQ